MMTKEQAREKWCPFVRVGFGMNAPDQSCIAATGNRMTTMDDECNCIASDCMAWRWTPLKVTPEYLDAVRALAEATAEKAPFAKAARAVADKPEAHGLPSKPFRGYCGLAGKE